VVSFKLKLNKEERSGKSKETNVEGRIILKWVLNSLGTCGMDLASSE
jgi:hypothetical protein